MSNWRGGFLNGKEIGENLEQIFVPGTVFNPGKQIQQAGVDLTVATIWRGGREIIPVKGWWYLQPGAYWVEFNEQANQNHEFAFLPNPRSTLFRIGGNLECGRMNWPMFYERIIGGSLWIENPFGIALEKGARVAQALVSSPDIEFEYPHFQVAISETLTVDKIFAYRSKGILGIEHRGVETEQVESAKLGEEGFLVQFEETIAIANDEVVFSWFDAVHADQRQKMLSTRPHVSPWSFMFAMGAVADPGYVGKLNACVHSRLDQMINPGDTLLDVVKHKVTPVDNANLYNGKYQGTGVSHLDTETVKWRDTLFAP